MADQTEHGHPDGLELSAPHIKKLETYFALLIFMDFRTVWYLCNVFIRGAIKEFFGFEATLFIFVEQGNRIKS